MIEALFKRMEHVLSGLLDDSAAIQQHSSCQESDAVSSPGYVPGDDNGARDFLVRCQRTSHPQMNTSHPYLYLSYTKTQQLTSMTGVGPLGGAFWGMLFFIPFFGLAVGAAIGALMGHFAHYGIDEGFINQVRAKITPGTSALFLLSSGAVVDKVADAVKGQQFEIIQTNLSKEQEDQLRKDFGEE